MNQGHVQYYRDLVKQHPDKKDLILDGAYAIYSSGNEFDTPPDLDTVLNYGQQYRAEQPFEITKGFKSAVQQMQGAGYGALGMVGAAVGSDKLRDYGYEGYQRNMQEAAEFQPRVDRVENIGGFGDAVDWFMGTLGSLGPSVIEAGVSAMAGGGIGGLIARKAGKEAIETAVEKYVAKKVAEGIGEAEARRVAAETVAQIAKQAALESGAKTAARGRSMGLVAGVAPVESGSMYGEAADDVGIEKANPYTALGLGTLSGLSELAGPEGKVLTQGVAKTTRRKALKEIPFSMNKEGFQEVTQTGLSTINALINNPDAEVSGSEFFNSYAAGSVGGLTFATPGVVRSWRNNDKQAPEKKDPKEPQDLLERTRTIDINEWGIPSEEIDSYPDRFGTATPAKTSAEVFEKELGESERLRQSDEGKELLRRQLVLEEEAGQNYPISNIIGAITRDHGPDFGNEVAPSYDENIIIDDKTDPEPPDGGVGGGGGVSGGGGGGLPISNNMGLTQNTEPEFPLSNITGAFTRDPAPEAGPVSEAGPALTANAQASQGLTVTPGIIDQPMVQPTTQAEVIGQITPQVDESAASTEPVIPDGVNLATSGRPFSKRGAKKAAELQSRIHGKPTQTVDLGNGKFGWSFVDNEGPARDTQSSLSVTGESQKVDNAAHEAATSPKNERTEPTQAQKEAGNYKKGHINISGLDIAVENPEGSVRSGVSEDGKKWETEMRSHYGYFKRTEGKDGDQVDVFVVPGTEAVEKVHIVDQIGPDGKFDEHKVILGAKSKIHARAEYLKNYEKGWKSGPVTEMTLSEFKAWLKDGKRTKQPVSSKLSKNESSTNQERRPGLSEKPTMEKSDGLATDGQRLLDKDVSQKSEVEGEEAYQFTDESKEKTAAPVETQEAGIDGDVRGFRYAIEKDGNIISSGSIPAMADPNADHAKTDYYKNLADRAGGKLYLAPTGESKSNGNNNSPLIFGKTWEEIQAMQQGKSVSSAVRSAMPENATMVYDSQASVKEKKTEALDKKDKKEHTENKKQDEKQAEKTSDKEPEPKKEKDSHVNTSGTATQSTGKVENDRGSIKGDSAGHVQVSGENGGPEGLPDGDRRLDNTSLRGRGEEDYSQTRDRQKPSEGSDGTSKKDKHGPANSLENDYRGDSSKPVDHTIQPGDLTRQGGWKTVAKNNLDAIELLKKIQSEKRNATPEEQAILARFAGWGASELANNMFPGYARYGEIITDHAKPEWKDLVTRLKNVLTDDELKTAAKSTQYAHYTSEKIVRSIYNVLQKMGFKGGKILEPGMGVGNFIGLIPEALKGKIHYTGIEMDHITAGIAKLLYPNQNIKQNDFIKQILPDDFFDASIGNPPFKDLDVIADPNYAKYRFSLHNYFFAKSIDKVKPGGILIFVTSRYTMDSEGDRARQYLSERADLLGAIRLPQTAFKENAGTDVVTDVIFLRKREKGEAVGGESWTGVKEIILKDSSGNDKSVNINEYFEKHPEMILGVNSLEGSMYSKNEYTVKQIDGDIEELFAKATENLPENVYRDQIITKAEHAAQEIIERDFDPKNKKEGGYYLHEDGKTIMWTRSGMGVPFDRIKLSPASKAMVADYISLRDTLKLSHMAQLNDGDWEAALKKLQDEYKQFVAKHGRINEYTTVVRTITNEEGEQDQIEEKRYKKHRFFKHDAEWTLIAALEEITDTGEIVEGPSLKERVIMRPKEAVIKSVPDALAVSLDKIGVLDLDHVAELANKPVDEVIESLGDLLFISPQNETYLTADEYLSGNVVAKLEEAKIAAKADPKFQKNVEALEKVQPEPLTSKDITVNLGAPWVPIENYNQFAQEVLGIDGGRIIYSKAVGAWTVVTKTAPQGYRSASDEWSTVKRGKNEILEAILNNRTIKITETYKEDGKTITVTDQQGTTAANELAKKMRAAFSTWVWRDVDRASELLEIYNKDFNNLAPRKFDGSHLTLPGTTLTLDLYQHQKDAIWRVIQTGNTYLNHAVGAGKTFTMIAAGMEMRRMGLVRKPLYVVPNHMLNQFAYEFQELYPTANILVADEENFQAKNRKMFVSKATLNNPDAIVMTHSSFGLIKSQEENIKPVKEQFLAQMRFALDAMREDNEAPLKIKKMETMIERASQRFDSLIGKGDDVVTFEDMGVDFLFVDEAHEFRKLDYATNRQVKGIDPAGSKKSIDLYIKTLWLEKMNEGRSHVFASGTPIVNTLGEMYTILRFFAMEELEQNNIEHFDTWANMFGLAESDYEMNAAGKYQLVERFSKFMNIPELMSRVRQFTDVLTSKQLGLRVGRPDIKGGVPEIVLAPKSTDLSSYQKGVLQKRIEDSKKWKPSPGQKGNPDPIVNIITDGRLASIDMRFIYPELENNPNSKLNKYIDGIIETWKETKDNEYFVPKTDKKSEIKGGTQICFFNTGFGEDVAKTRGFNAREWAMKRFAEAGIPSSQIAWIDDYNTSAKKQALFRDLRDGKKRILFGSAKKMGTGVNVQARLTHLHYLDPPWFPADVEQPDGRILRQGNQNKEIVLKRYATEGSYDATMWQMVARKARFIEQAWTGEKGVRSIEDVSEVSQYAMASAIASGDQRIIQLTSLQADVSRLETLQAAHTDNQIRLVRDSGRIKVEIEKAEAGVEKYKEAQKKFPNYVSTTQLNGTVDGKVYNKSTDLNEAITEKIKKLSINEEGNFNIVKKTEVANINGAGILISIGKNRQLNISVTLGNDLEFYFNKEPIKRETFNEVESIHYVTRSLNTINKIASDISILKREVENKKDELKRVQKRIGAPFEYAQELTEKFTEMKALEEELAEEGKEEERTADENKQMAAEEGQPAAGKDIKKSETTEGKPLKASSISELTPKQRRAVRQLKAKGKVSVVTAEEAIAILEQAGLSAEEARLMVAYHGTPHDVDQFSTDKIGTGEGAQVYGHGLYFAGSRNVAEWYKKSLPPKDLERSFLEKLTEDASIEEVMAEVENGSFTKKQAAVLTALNNNDWLGFDFPAQAISTTFSEDLQFFDPTPELVKAVKEYGNLYQVELAPSEDAYLMWDKPLKDQSEKIKEIIRKVRGRRGSDLERVLSTAFYGWSEKGKTGRSVQRYLEAHLGKKGASDALKSIGIRGIKYLDGTSRSKGEGDYNYVIFDDADVKITAKYSKDGKVQGFTLPDGRVFLIPENIESGQLWGVIRHEVGVHVGKLLQNDKGFARLKRVFEAKRHENSPTGQAIREAFAKVPKDTAPEHVTEEAMAYLVAAGSDISLATRILNYIKRILVKLGMSPGIFTADDYVLLAEAALKREAKISANTKAGPEPENKKPLYSVAGVKDYVADTFDETIDYLGDLYSRRGDLVTGVKGAWKYRNAKGFRDKTDITWFEKAFGLVSHYSKKIPAFARAFNIALQNQDIKTMVEQELTHGPDGEKYIKTISDFRSKSKADYNRLSSYMNERDINRIGYVVREEGDFFTVLDLEGKATDHVFGSESEALEKAIELEAQDYIKNGGTAEAARVLSLIRTINNRSFNLRRKRFQEVEQMCKDNGIEVPAVVYVENGKEVRVNLKQKLLEMGDMRGFYMPRIRNQGEYMLYATKKGENPVLKFYDTRVFANAARANMEKQGYSAKVQQSGRLGEDLFEQLGSIMAQQAVINESLKEISKENKLVTLENLNIENYMDGDTLVLRGEFRDEFIPTLEKMGGVRETKPRVDGAAKGLTYEYRFENPEKGLEHELAAELFKIDGVTRMFQTVALRFAGAFVSQYADIIRSRGSRSAMISRSEAIGKDVTIGFEEDALTRTVKSTLSLAGGEAKARTALSMVQAITGRDVSWNDFSRIKRFKGTFEDFEQIQKANDQQYIDRETFDEIRNNWLKAPQYVDYIEFINGRGIDPARQKTAHSEAMALFKDMMRNEERVDRVVGTLKGMAVLKYLGGRVSAPVVNMTNMVLGVPAAMMGYGNIKAKLIPKLIGNAYKDYRQFKTGKLGAGEQFNVFTEIEKRGWDQAQFNQEGLAAIQNRMSFGYGKMIETSMMMFSWSEKLNRVATISAAYNGLLESAPEMTFEERLNKAKEISDKAHGIYGKANRPSMMRGGSVGANVMQSFYVFKTFTHNYLATMYDLGVNERDAKAVAWMLFSPAIFGAGASMGATGIIYVIGKAMGSDDPEEDFYKAVESRFGSYAGNFSRFGILGAFDHGISIKGSLDAVGVGDLPTSLKDIVGAPGSVLMDTINGLDQIRRGNVMKGMEGILPLAAGSPIKAYREYTEGITTKSNAPVLFEGEPLKADTIDSFLRAFSFNPSRIAGAREKLWGERSAEQAFLERRQEIYARLKKHYLSKKRSPKELQDINVMIAGYNARAKKEGQKIIQTKNIKAVLKKAKVE